MLKGNSLPNRRVRGTLEVLVDQAPPPSAHSDDWRSAVAYFMLVNVAQLLTVHQGIRE